MGNPNSAGDRTDMRKKLRSLPANLVIAGANLIVLASLLGFAGALWWGFDLVAPLSASAERW